MKQNETKTQNTTPFGFVLPTKNKTSNVSLGSVPNEFFNTILSAYEQQRGSPLTREELLNLDRTAFVSSILGNVVLSVAPQTTKANTTETTN